MSPHQPTIALSVPPAEAAIAELRQDIENLVLSCQAIPDGSNSCCGRQCRPSSDLVEYARQAVDESPPPFPWLLSFRILPLVLCSRHCHDDRYWAPLLFDLAGVTLSREQSAVEQLASMSNLPLRSTLKDIMAQYHENRIGNSAQTTQTNRAGSFDMSTFSPMSSLFENSEDSRGPSLLGPTSFLFSKLTLLLKEPMQCIALEHNSVRCEEAIASPAQDSVRKMIEQDCHVSLLPLLVQSLLCRRHFTDSRRKAYVQEWRKHFSHDDDAISIRTTEPNFSTPTSIRRGRLTSQSTPEIVDLVSDDETWEENPFSASPTPNSRQRHVAPSIRGLRSVSDPNVSRKRQARKHSSNVAAFQGLSSTGPADTASTSTVDTPSIRMPLGAEPSPNRARRSAPLGLDGTWCELSFNQGNSISGLQSESEDLLTDLRGIRHATGVIPRKVMDLAREELRNGLLHTCNFGDEVATMETETNKDVDDEIEFWYWAHRILDAAWRCSRTKTGEAGWNNEVHSHVLQHTFMGSKSTFRNRREIEGVCYQNVTTASIHPSCFPKSASKTQSPRSSAPKPPSSSAPKFRKVDYVILIEPSEVMKRLIKGKIQDERGLDAINHTTDESVRFSPIAVSIETKPAWGDGNKALTQLSTWVAAHFNRLDQLVNGKVWRRGEQRTREPRPLPNLPLVQVVGNDWKFIIAKVRCDQQRLDIITGMTIGTTETILGIYQLRASLRRLGRWVNEVYKPWFEKEVLGIDLV